MASNPGRPSNRLVTVYQAANADLRELFLGATDLLMDRLAEEFAARRPGAVAHWKPSHAVSLRLLSYAVLASDVPAFLDGFLPDSAYRGWKILREP